MRVPSTPVPFTSALAYAIRRAARAIAFLTVFLVGAIASPAFAETLLMPGRDMLTGSQVVWGVTTFANHTGAAPTTYSIAFGDGTPNATGNVTDRSYIAVTHNFTS